MTYQEGLSLTGPGWAGLSEEVKLEALQAIENHMALEGGRLPCPVRGEFLYTGIDGIVIGTYDPGKRTIYINSSQFDGEAKYGKTPEALVTACLHEGRHAYQHQVVNGMVKYDNAQEAEAWKENLSPGRYISFRQNPRAYYSQPVEADARSFAEARYQQMTAERERIITSEQIPENPAKQIFMEQMNGRGRGEADRAADYRSSEDRAWQDMNQTAGQGRSL